MYHRAQIFPQLYFSQTPILKVGPHDNGKISRVDDHTMGQNCNGQVVGSRQNLIDNLRVLVPLLKQMKRACQQYGRLGKPLAFFWSGAGPLELYEIKHVKGSHKLPEDVLESL